MIRHRVGVEWVSVFLPVAGISINIWVLIGAGGLVGFLAGLTPILIMAGLLVTFERADARPSREFTAASSTWIGAAIRSSRLWVNGISNGCSWPWPRCLPWQP